MASSDRVAAAPSLRILVVVITLPFAYRFLGLRGSDPYAQATTIVDRRGLSELLMPTLVGGFVFQRLCTPNACVLGSLAVAIPLTAAEVDFSAMPSLLSNAAQLLIGRAPGSRFHRDFLEGRIASSPRSTPACCSASCCRRHLRGCSPMAQD